MDIVDQIRMKFEALAPLMDERLTRLWAAAEAMALGRGGEAAVTKATGILGKRLLAGKRELDALARGAPSVAPLDAIRREGGGRKKATEKDAELLDALDALIDPVTRGDPQSPLRWTSKSTTKLAKELTAQNHATSPSTVGRLLHQMGYSLQAERKTREGTQHPERNAQFEDINRRVKDFHARELPVISVDTKKKELIGDFKNGGREWQPKGEPSEVRVHDFIDKKLGKAVPYGVYDILRNEGWVNVGIDADTAEFAVESIRRWWKRMGSRSYHDATDLLITADCGGSNGARVRLWKLELQRLADETKLRIHVSHYPPGTSKWNKIEHRMFSHITENWRGRPLESIETVVNTIGATTTAKGLRIRAALDSRRYERGIKVSDREMHSVNIHRARLRGDWNYRIDPSSDDDGR